jgi:hypothetical protein
VWIAWVTASRAMVVNRCNRGSGGQGVVDCAHESLDVLLILYGVSPFLS